MLVNAEQYDLHVCIRRLANIGVLLRINFETVEDAGLEYEYLKLFFCILLTYKYNKNNF